MTGNRKEGDKGTGVGDSRASSKATSKVMEVDEKEKDTDIEFERQEINKLGTKRMRIWRLS